MKQPDDYPFLGYESTKRSRRLDPSRDLSFARAVVSLLHENEPDDSLNLHFRGQPILAWTLQRLAQVTRLAPAVVMCWDDQKHRAADIAELAGVTLICKGKRQFIPSIEATAVSRRWSEGWRGGLCGASAFDRGFHAQWLEEAAECFDARAVVLVDPAAALIDPFLIDQLIERALASPAERVIFNHAASGAGAMLLRREMLVDLARTNAHPGLLLSYHPDRIARDPVSTRACVPASKRIARASVSLLLDSRRQVDAIERVLGSEPLAETETIVARLEDANAIYEVPSDVTIELTVRRSTTPVWSALSNNAAAGQINRPDMSMDDARSLASELAASGSRVTFSGVGDPLLHPEFEAIIQCFADAGVKRMHIETDLLNVSDRIAEAVVRAKVDVVSVHVPALTPETYRAICGVDRLGDAIEGLTRLLKIRVSMGQSVPLIAPLFVKCRSNQMEMEAWVDQWIRATGSAVVRGATSLCGLIENASPMSMAPPLRRACRRLASSIHVLSDGTITTCEQDVKGEQSLANLSQLGLMATWRTRLRQVNEEHQAGRWNQYAACVRCDQWDRPV